MPLTRSGPHSHSRRSLVILGVLVACLLLIGALGWQTWRMQQSNQSAAAAVLSDYGILAADEFGRRFSKSLGYFGYFALARRCGEVSSALALYELVFADIRLRESANLVHAAFWHDGTNLDIAGGEVTTEVRRLINELRNEAGLAQPDRLQNRTERAMERAEREAQRTVEGAYQLATVASTHEPVIYTFPASDTEQQPLCGFVIDTNGFANFVQHAIDWGPLLPASLAGGMVGNELLFIEILDPQGRSLAKVNPLFDSDVAVVRPFAGDPDNILEGFRVRVGLNSYAASKLIIGGLPESRVPLLIAMMTMSTLLLITAIWLLRREQSIMRMREDFVSQVSHELRTPLTQIRMFAETLLLGRARGKDDEKRSLEIIDRESRRLSQLVENVLRASKVSDAVPVDCTPQPLSAIVGEVCASVQATNDRVTIRLDTDDRIVANIDPGALRQVVVNLIDNAVKYGPEGQTIDVSVAGAGRYAHIVIQDEGPGIPEADRERVWNTFVRLDREKAAAISGTGIGLSVAREMVEAMGGRCWFAASDTGARVVVEFPQVTADG